MSGLSSRSLLLLSLPILAQGLLAFEALAVRPSKWLEDSEPNFQALIIHECRLASFKRVQFPQSPLLGHTFLLAPRMTKQLSLKFGT